jgi:hypothetical protein
VVECLPSRSARFDFDKTLAALRDRSNAMPRFIACSKNQGNPFDGQLRACRRRRDAQGRR